MSYVKRKAIKKARLSSAETEGAIMRSMIRAMNEMMAEHYADDIASDRAYEWRLADEPDEWVLTLEPTIGNRIR